MRYRNDTRARQLSEKDEFMEENELLNLKLEVDYGMAGSNMSAQRTTLENQWLNSFGNVEQQHKRAERIKVYDYLGCPAFKRMDQLKPEEIGAGLDIIRSHMEKKGIVLNFNCDVDPVIMYRFITEELFKHEIDDVSNKGMVIHFIYEEFHPNYDLDLRNHADELIEILFRKKWDRFDAHCFAGRVDFKGVQYRNEGIAGIIQSFQEAHDSFSVEQFEIEDVQFDLRKQYAEVDARIRYRAKGDVIRYFDGTCRITFLFQWGYWYINGFALPGFGD